MDVTEPPHAPSPECRSVNQIISRIGDKWSVLVIMLLHHKPHRFSELKRGIGGVSQRMLTLTLRNLERDGLVDRTVTPSIPPRVDYELTELGHSLADPVKALGSWAFQNLDHIARAQVRYDTRGSE